MIHLMILNGCDLRSAIVEVIYSDAAGYQIDITTQANIYITECIQTRWENSAGRLDIIITSYFID